MKLADTDLFALLPGHLLGDSSLSAVGKAINPWLNKISRSIPNLLLYARLDYAANRGGKKVPDTFLSPLARLTKARERPGSTFIDCA